jgi:hypothetical protein
MHEHEIEIDEQETEEFECLVCGVLSEYTVCNNCHTEFSL